MKTTCLIILITSTVLLLFAQSPQWEWITPTEQQIDWKLAPDNEGNLYIAGDFDSTLVLGNTTLICKGKKDLYLAKKNQDGNWLWAIQSGNASEVRCLAISLDESGNILITGSFSGTCRFGETTLTSAGEADMFIAKLDTDGNWAWATQTGGDSYVGATFIKGDPFGNIYISGTFQAKAAFGDTLKYSLPTCFISKLDTNGKWLWTYKISSKSPVPHAISLDGQGNLYITGNFSGAITVIDSIIASSGMHNSFVAKLNPYGELQWLARNVAEYGSTIWSIATDKDGNSYVTGTGGGKLWFGKHYIKCHLCDVIVAKLDPNGNWEWVRKSINKQFAMSMSVDLDQEGNPIIAGTYDNKIRFGSIKLKSQGSWDAFVVKLDKKGNWQWVIQGGGKGYEDAFGIKTDTFGNAFITGTYSGNANFGNHKLTSLKAGPENHYIAKIKF